ncbi:hypothetical protein BSZ22_20680 [Bradyrhizobium canariense]|uniref:Uncharacterized protein n=1 Tax=Bradyrhizobium canariense TaxID=255045 RepID=A0A1X3H365_9BRAD|nr:hypothetical protein BSZ22_20680 [Bradyrhizobium canariense]OSI78034.1 hypothetical protein BSZ23_19680 [Bradyrhizobium canariense]OSI89264.1 hypothetical protein BSZ25_21150 [Bradyrhizobium canariense]OSI93746.1 hypothetical protein BSZ24_12380 [Bradyrhizobium canariense]OSJ03063.1 hypothetical protein BSZ16_16575 [Bradyrhizobium canariense]
MAADRNRVSNDDRVAITRELAGELPATRTGDTVYLVNDFGRPFTISGLGNKMREWCDTAVSLNARCTGCERRLL